MITTDGGGEFINSLLIPYCHELSIMKNTTAPYTPQQNSIVERGMRTVVTKARSLMIHSGVPPKFWSLACQSAVFIQNKIFTKSRKEDDEIPYKLWYGHDPNRDYIRTFGCLAYIHNQKEIRDSKVSPTSRKGFLVGFDEFNKNYKIYDYENERITNTHDVTFNEESFPERGEPHESPFDNDHNEIETSPAVDQPNNEKEAPTTDSTPPRRSSRISNLPRRSYFTTKWATYARPIAAIAVKDNPKYEPNKLKDIQYSPY
ncbi:hypothetical protein MJO28_003696 [Puccinia striiformis f. sp. tritici]|uniref:Uncharacterized protein n=1 Tax=Puccinia striiformis f. sp. tritici TaxID=168172 RepID=A0ACC0EMG5_9BASI|nr:hypothetical protein MJO28_003696 [Puccinia striiformis f. sp. tritici]